MSSAHLKNSKVSLAALAQVKRAALARPAVINFSRNPEFSAASFIAPARSSTFQGFTRSALSPRISGREVRSAATTGQPLAWASSGGKPNPSKKDGYTKTLAKLYNEILSSWLTAPRKIISLEN